MKKIDYKNRSNGQYFFWHYVIRFFFVGIVTIVLLIPSYYIMMNSMKQIEIRSLSANMEERFQKLNSTLNMVAGQARLASNEISIVKIGMARELSKEDGKDQYELSQARRWFNSSINQDDLLVNAYMLSRNNSAFVSRNLVTTEAQEIYGIFYEIDGYSREEWQTAVLKSSENFAFLPSQMTNGTFEPTLLNQKEPIIHMMVPISDYGIKSNQVMVYMLSTKQLFHDITPIPMGSYLCLKDKTGTVLAACGTQGEILEQIPEWMRNESLKNKEELEVLYSKDGITGLEVICYVPQSYFSEKLEPVQRMTGYMSAGILLLVAILSFFMAASHSSLERRTLRMIEKIYPEIMKTSILGRKKRKLFGDYVLGTIRMLDEKQRDYKERLYEMKNSLEVALLEKMIHGEAITEREIENCREVLEIEEGYFVAIYLRVADWGGAKSRSEKEHSSQMEATTVEEQNMVCQIVVDVIRHHLDITVKHPSFYYEEGQREGVFLLYFPDWVQEEKKNIQYCMEKAISYVEKHVDVQICIGIGSMVFGISKIVQSVREAKRAAEQENRKLLLGEEEDKKNRRGVLFSSKSMRKLSVFLSNGEEEETRKLFHELNETIEESDLSVDEAKQIFYGVRSVLDGMTKKEGKEGEELPGFEEKREIKGQMDDLKRIALNICERMRLKQEKVMTKKRSDVISFIQENYSDSNLCAAMLAEKFGVTEKYVFQIVRDCTGKSLGDLIKEIRFIKAEELLQSTIDINKIPDKIGFNSLNTFYKAFKRNYGISPGQWRELNKEGQESEQSEE